MGTRERRSSAEFKKVVFVQRLKGKISETQEKKKPKEKKARALITVNVLGSAGPIRFVVNEDTNVARVINKTLKLYAREGRLPILGSDAKEFLLYPANAELDALEPSESIGCVEVRNFVLCKKPRMPSMTEAGSEMTKNGKGIWKAWINKSFSFKILISSDCYLNETSSNSPSQ